MPRRTPLVAIILAPVVLYFVAVLWKTAIVPIYRAVRYSDTVAGWRLDREAPAARISAIKDLSATGSADREVMHELVVRLHSDESIEVRKAAAEGLGRLGRNTPLPEAAKQALSMLVLSAEDDAMLNAVIAAVGQSAAKNHYADDVTGRIARIFNEKHHAWLYSQAATVLGQLGAAQALSAAGVAQMNRSFRESTRPGERENLANAFTEMAKGGHLPATTLDILADAFEQETNRRIRIAILYALAHSAADYPRARTVMAAAADDPDRDIARTAESGMRIIEAERIFAGTDPVALALDTSRPVAERLQGLRVTRSAPIDPEVFGKIAPLAHDPHSELAIAALEMFHHLARDPGDDFDRNVVIPELERAMTHADPLMRKAAFGALSTISIQRPKYLRAADFPEHLEAGAADPDAKVRLVVLVAMLRAARSTAGRDAVIERAMRDPDPYVRANAVSWLGSPKTKTGSREAFLERALQDPDADVRATAATAEQSWSTRKRAWPVELWQRLRAGEHGKVGMTILIAVTVAAPVLIGAAFLLYYVARALAYLLQRRWRATAVIPVMGIWLAASYGMFMLYFIAAHAGNSDTGELLMLAGVLWLANALYGALGWGLHYAVRR